MLALLLAHKLRWGMYFKYGLGCTNRIFKVLLMSRFITRASWRTKYINNKRPKTKHEKIYTFATFTKACVCAPAYIEKMPFPFWAVDRNKVWISVAFSAHLIPFKLVRLHPISQRRSRPSEAAKLLVACRRHPFIYYSAKQAWTAPLMSVHTVEASLIQQDKKLVGKVMDMFVLKKTEITHK